MTREQVRRAAEILPEAERTEAALSLEGWEKCVCAVKIGAAEVKVPPSLARRALQEHLADLLCELEELGCGKDYAGDGIAKREAK